MSPPVLLVPSHPACEDYLVARRARIGSYVQVMCASLTVSDQMSAQRRSALTSLFSVLSSAINELMAPQMANPLIPPPSTTIFKSPLCRTGISCSIQQECRTFCLGSLIRSLVPTGYYPPPSPLLYSKSVSDCRNELTTTISQMLTLKSISYSHSLCTPASTLISALASVQAEFTLTAAQEERLTKQALRSGIL